MTQTPIPNSELDRILTAQFADAWAGENGEQPRLGWSRFDLVSEFGGLDLFRRRTSRTRSGPSGSWSLKLLVESMPRCGHFIKYPI